jgi:predicted HAD superfamily Cof-like phosphohydrolase
MDSLVCSEVADLLAAALGKGGGDPVQRDVEDFHQALDLTIGETPALRDEQLRADLILEEARETAEAITGRRVELYVYNDDTAPERPQSLVDAIDGLCDLLAVVYAAAVTFGIDLAPFWAEVHRTNMAKAGGPKRADGKQLKPEGWTPPQLEPILAEQEGRR